MTGTRLETALAGLIEPLLEPEGYELVGLEFQGGRRGVLRIFVDHAAGREPFSIDDCVRVSRLVEPALDAADLIATAYSLEVSSPGVERPLRRPQDFRRFAGERASMSVPDPRAGRRVVSGRILDPDDEGFSLESEGEIVRYAYHDVEKAHLEFVFGTPHPKKK